MNSTKTAVMAMIVALAMIGMTGLAMAGSAMDYEIDFSSVGTGSVSISTVTPVGADVQQSSWTNCRATGYQDGTYGGSTWTQIDRRTTITGIVNGNPASGTILTQSMPTTPVSDLNKLAHITTLATYHDDSAYGSHVRLVQGVRLYDSDVPVINDAGYEYADVDTRITGYAYDSGNAVVSGSVVAVTDGSLTAATCIDAVVSDGSLRMIVDSLIRDETDDDETSKTTYKIYVRSQPDTADGYIGGHAAVNGVIVDSIGILYTNTDMTVTGHFYAVTL